MRFPRPLLIAIACLVMSAPWGVAANKSAPPAKPLTVTVLWDDAMSGKEAGVWMGYLFARMKYVSSHGGQYAHKPGVIAPRYDEEVHARTEAVHIYRDIRARKPEMVAAYFEALERVEAAGYMREYVWRYLRHPEWIEPPSALREQEFDRWAGEHLAAHRAQTRGRIALTRGDG